MVYITEQFIQYPLQSLVHVSPLSGVKLFREAGVSQRLYDEFLEPMLLVLPMCPGEDCSAAAALSCFQYFALEHQARSSLAIIIHTNGR